MSKHLLTLLLLTLGACTSSHKSSGPESTIRKESHQTGVIPAAEPMLPAGSTASNLMELPQTREGGFVLAPGFYEAAFKSYCLQPGTPDPSSRDAYYPAAVSGYRKEIVQAILLKSRNRPDLQQRNIQLLLWSVVSGANYDRLGSAVKATANQLLTSRQIFELKGGVAGIARQVSAMIPGQQGTDIRRVIDLGTDSYEAVEKLAVLKEPSVVHRPEVKRDQWYQEKGNYYVRWFPEGYQTVKIQIYVPDGLLDSSGRNKEGDYLVYDPTGLIAQPANSNSQRLGVGAPVVDIIRKIIEITPRQPRPKKLPPVNPKAPSGQSAS